MNIFTKAVVLLSIFTVLLYAGHMARTEHECQQRGYVKAYISWDLSQYCAGSLGTLSIISPLNDIRTWQEQ